MTKIYLDHNATTPLDEAALDAMLPYLRDSFGNPSSLHTWGRDARIAVDRARQQVAALIHAQPDEIVFTGGGTEADNAALFGVVEATSARTLLVSAVEHHAVLEPAERLALRGIELQRVPVDRNARIDIEALAQLLPETPFLASIMLANNDVGTLQPIRETGAVVHARDGILHTDAVQAAGRVPIDVNDLGADLLSLSAHKLYGPKGVGALYIRRGTPFAPLLRGGKHEDGRRAGTENVAGIVGFGAACARAEAILSETAAHTRALRDRFEADVTVAVAGASVNAAGAERLPNTSSIRFEGIEADLLAMSLDLEGIAASVGSACVSGSRDPSHVLLAMGQTSEQARNAVRFSFGSGNTHADVDATVAALVRVVKRLRGKAT